jgi:NADH-quinone oxidoreductase subunit E
MLTEKEKNEILEEARLYPSNSVACLDALKIVQQHRGWISDESVRDIAELLTISAEQVEGVATFYTRIYRKEIGRHVILICDGISCMILGYERIYDLISHELGLVFGETTPDKRFTLLPVSCLGDCDHSPSMMIDDDLYHDLKAEDLDQILEKYK